MPTKSADRQIVALTQAFTQGQLDRRQFMRRMLGLGLGVPMISAIIAACTSAAATPAPTIAPTAVPTAAPSVAPSVAATAAASIAPTAASVAPSVAASASASAAAPAAASAAVSGMDLTALIAAAKAEGSLYQTGIPPEWVNYQGIFDLWTQKYGIPIQGTATEGEYSSGQELDSIKNTGKPDVGDVGLTFARQAQSQGLTQPYKHSFWADIPDDAKDPEGYWSGNYWGAQAFVINTDAVKIPITDWKDLLDPSLRNAVGIDGDPNKASDSFFAVWSAALGSGGGADDIGPGVDFFNKLQQSGNLTPARASDANILSGEVKVAIKWDYLGLAVRDKAAGAPNISVLIPASGSFASPYADIIARTAPHPNAAKLWQEHVYSDEAQLLFLKGYAHPIRFDALNEAGKIPADLAAKLPAAELYAKVQLMTDAAQADAAAAKLKSLWTLVVNS